MTEGHSSWIVRAMKNGMAGRLNRDENKKSSSVDADFGGACRAYRMRRREK